jgi:hypothetical protein
VEESGGGAWWTGGAGGGAWWTGGCGVDPESFFFGGRTGAGLMACESCDADTFTAESSPMVAAAA